MTIDPSQDCKIITDYENEDGALEQPVIVENYKGSDGVSITGYDNDSVFIPYRMVPEVIKAMKNYLPKTK